MKKVIYTAQAILLSILFALLPFSVYADTPQKDSTNDAVQTQESAESIETLENDFLKLSVCSSGENAGSFTVTRKQDGAVWYSNPANRFENKTDMGIAKTDAFSQLIFRVYDSDRKIESNINSFSGTNEGERIKIENNKDSIKILYIFDDQRIAIPLTLSFNNDEFIAGVNAADILQNGTCSVLSISVLPYFGCGTAQESGNIFVPDGCGALINFNNHKENAKRYEVPVFGEDINESRETVTSSTEKALLPVFGISSENNSFMGIIEDGAASANIIACSSGIYNSYNNAYAAFTLCANDNLTIGNSKGNTVSSEVYDFQNKLFQRASVRYCFLNKKDSYVQMALKYREYLQKSLYFTKTEVADIPQLVLDVYGGVMKQGTILGLPVKRYETMTTISQAENIVSDLKQAGIVSPVMIYRNSDNDLVRNKMQEGINLSSELGSIKELKELRDELSGQIYWEYDPFSVKKSGNGFSKIFDVSKRICKDSLLRYSYKLSTYYSDLNIVPDSIAAPGVLTKLGTRFLKNCDKNKINPAFTSLGNVLYTDFSGKRFSAREQTMQKFAELLQKTSAVVYEPNSYAAVSQSCLADVPVNSSEFNIEDSEVPFYQIVFSGLKDYSVRSINLETNPRKVFLKALETASSLKFSVAYSGIENVKGTEYSYLCSAGYSQCKDDIIDLQNQMQDVYEKIGSREIINHESVEQGVFHTVFSSGKSLYVNYNSYDVEANGVTVPLLGYIVSD